MAKGPPMYKNLSLGAQQAIAESPPTTPAVYLKYVRKVKLHFRMIIKKEE